MTDVNIVSNEMKKSMRVECELKDISEDDYFLINMGNKEVLCVKTDPYKWYNAFCFYDGHAHFFADSRKVKKVATVNISY